MRTGAARLAAVERGYRLDRVLVELEIEDLEVLFDPARRGRLREYDASSLDVPPQNDLGRAAADFAGDLRDHRVVEHAALGDRRPRLGHDPDRLPVGADLVVEEVRMQLDLVDRGNR